MYLNKTLDHVAILALYLFPFLSLFSLHTSILQINKLSCSIVGKTRRAFQYMYLYGQKAPRDILLTVLYIEHTQQSDALTYEPWILANRSIVVWLLIFFFFFFLVTITENNVTLTIYVNNNLINVYLFIVTKK